MNILSSIKEGSEWIGNLLAAIFVFLVIAVFCRFLFVHPGWNFILLFCCPFMAYALSKPEDKTAKYLAFGAFAISCVCTFMIFDTHGKSEIVIDRMFLNGRQTNEEVWVEYQERDNGPDIPAHYETEYRFVPDKNQSPLIKDSIGWFVLLFPLSSNVICYFLLKRSNNSLI